MRDLIMSAYAVGAERWSAALLDATLKGILLLLLAGLVAVALRRAPAAARHFVWTVAISALVLLPFVGSVAPKWDVGVLPASITPSSIKPSSVVPSSATTGTAPTNVVAPIPSIATPNSPPKTTPLASPRKHIAQSNELARNLESAVAPASMEASAVQATVIAPAPRNWWLIASLVWITGALLLAARMILGLLGTALLARRSRIVEDADWIALTNRVARQLGITRPVTLLQSQRSGVPMTWGVFYPVILLPEDASHWSVERRSIVLLHELAHVRRFDALTQTIAQLATALFWLNPLVWIAARQMRTERERACDDFVLSAGMRPSVYASDLLEIVQTMGSEPGMAYAALAMARRTEFEGRLLAILDPTTRRSGVSGFTKLATAVLALVLVIPLAGMRPAARTTPIVVQRPGSNALRGEQRGPQHVSHAGASVDSSAPAVRIGSSAGTQESPAPQAVQSFADLRVGVMDDADDSVSAPAPVAGAAKPRDDKETLILIVRAAAKMSSDYEKATLLTEVIEKFVGDDSLRLAFLATTATLTGDYERGRVLSALLAKDPLSDVSRVAFVKAAAGLSSDYTKRIVLTQFASKHELTNAAVRQAFFAAVNTMSAGYDQQLVLVELVKRLPKLTRDEALGLLAAAKGMSTNSNKSAVLIAVAEKIGLGDDAVRKAYIDTAGTLTSDSDYRRAMSAAIKTTPQEQ